MSLGVFIVLIIVLAVIAVFARAGWQIVAIVLSPLLLIVVLVLLKAIFG